MAPPTTKDAIQKKIDRVKEEKEEKKRKLTDLGNVLMDVQWRKTGCEVIITGNGPLEEKVAAQGQHKELVNMEHELNVKKERAQKRLLVLDEQQSILEHEYQFAV
jgi:hypothetical protein